MAECLECGDDFRLEDGCEDDGMCHECAHAIAEGQISAQVSARDLTIRELREELAAERARAERHREALEDAEDALGVALNDWHRTHTMDNNMRQRVQNAYASVSAALAGDGT